MFLPFWMKNNQILVDEFSPSKITDFIQNLECQIYRVTTTDWSCLIELKHWKFTGLYKIKRHLSLMVHIPIGSMIQTLISRIWCSLSDGLLLWDYLFDDGSLNHTKDKIHFDRFCRLFDVLLKILDTILFDYLERKNCFKLILDIVRQR